MLSHMNLTLKGTNLELSQALKMYVAEKIIGLEKYGGDISLAKIELERTTRHHQKGNVWRAEAQLRTKMGMLRADAVAAEMYQAIDKLRNELKRQLQATKGKRTSVTRRKAKSLSLKSK